MEYLRALPYLLILLAAVPLWGFVATGSWRAAWRFAVIWAKCVLLMALAGGLIAWALS